MVFIAFEVEPEGPKRAHIRRLNKKRIAWNSMMRRWTVGGALLFVSLFILSLLICWEELSAFNGSVGWQYEGFLVVGYFLAAAVVALVGFIAGGVTLIKNSPDAVAEGTQATRELTKLLREDEEAASFIVALVKNKNVPEQELVEHQYRFDPGTEDLVRTS